MAPQIMKKKKEAEGDDDDGVMHTEIRYLSQHWKKA